MKFYYAILAAAIATTTHQTTEAFSISSRKAFLAKAATTTSAAIIATTTPTIASAREGAFQRAVKEKKLAKEKYGPKPDDQQAARSKGGSTSRVTEGKEAADKIALGTELNKGQAEVAGGLMDKMGL